MIYFNTKKLEKKFFNKQKQRIFAEVDGFSSDVLTTKQLLQYGNNLKLQNKNNCTIEHTSIIITDVKELQDIQFS